MYIVDVSSDFLFFSAFLVHHKRQWGHNLQEANFLKCFDRCSQYLWKKQLKLQNLVKIMFFGSIGAFRKSSKTTDFDHFNYRFFKRIPSVPGTSNNRGLTVLSLFKNELIKCVKQQLLKITVIVIFCYDCKKCKYETYAKLYRFPGSTVAQWLSA